MARYLMNPISIPYKYQFVKEFYQGETEYSIYREAADPSIIFFKGHYYLFASMTAGFFTSKDLINWDFHDYKGPIPIGDYAPDVRVIDGYIYFSASRRESNCSFYRSKNPITDAFEEIEGTFPFWDPNLFVDDDNRIYFYWGCSNNEPIYGVELDKDTLSPIGKPQVMFDSDKESIGFERLGDDHIAPQSPEEIAEQVERLAQGLLVTPEEERLAIFNFTDDSKSGVSPLELAKMAISKYINDRPFIEGAWMTKYEGKYYLQYAAPGTQYNVYADGVYVSENPLGPFTLAQNNPYSYKPGGFINGAGHGSTFDDGEGNYYHTATAAISVNGKFERRLGIWKAGFDSDGELFCDQRFGDWPINLATPAFSKPDWMLLSYQKPVNVSSGSNSHAITNESSKDWWQADTNDKTPLVELDLGQLYDVRMIQVNFADSKLSVTPEKDLPIYKTDHNERVIDTSRMVTRWFLEGSADGERYVMLADKRHVETDLPHDAILIEEGIKIRYLRLTILAVPYNQAPCLSGIRVFGIGNGQVPQMADSIEVNEISPLDMTVRWNANDAIGSTVLWGFSPDKLYHSHLVMGKTEVNIGALVKDQPVYLRIDTFNESGVTEGNILCVRKK
ncbi:family 43 glycosylhydrolase [Streptococcus plurextorum]|uniref:family 43 glycosylhydrolase n=1 Tax=Streptococcus plurextorum TaxID=456876 RepID=UPI00041A041B|nr:family 43 glycosylhydrolase [Streptococcus plurextorum]